MEDNMDISNIFQKTTLGLQEVTNRTRKLPHKLRTMLILIDGSRPEDILKEEARIIGAPEDFIEQLLTADLIAKRGYSVDIDTDALFAPGH
jgi:hypothetical protein